MLQPGSRRLCHALARARSSLGADVLVAPPIEILLYLHAAESEGECPSADDLAALIGLPRLSTARWLAVLEGRGLIEVEAARLSSGRSCFRISLRAEQVIDGILASVGL